MPYARACAPSKKHNTNYYIDSASASSSFRLSAKGDSASSRVSLWVVSSLNGWSGPRTRRCTSNSSRYLKKSFGRCLANGYRCKVIADPIPSTHSQPAPYIAAASECLSRSSTIHARLLAAIRHLPIVQSNIRSNIRSSTRSNIHRTPPSRLAARRHPSPDARTAG